MDSDSVVQVGSPEEIPGSDLVFRRIPRSLMTADRPDPVAFRNATEDYQEPGMSVLWCKYARPSDCLALKGATPLDSVAELTVSHIREIEDQVVTHVPKALREEGGRAHTEVYGAKPAWVTKRLRDIAKLALQGPDKLPRDSWRSTGRHPFSDRIPKLRHDVADNPGVVDCSVPKGAGLRIIEQAKPHLQRLLLADWTLAAGKPVAILRGQPLPAGLGRNEPVVAPWDQNCAVGSFDSPRTGVHGIGPGGK